MTKQPTQDERTAFEAWLRREWPTAPLHHVRDALPVNDPRRDEYCNENIQRAWVGWQACAAWAAQHNPMSSAVNEYGDAYQGAREDLAIWKRRALEAENRPAVSQTNPCIWIYSESEFSWETGCGAAFSLVDGTPRENGMCFCHACGGQLVEAEICDLEGAR